MSQRGVLLFGYVFIYVDSGVAGEVGENSDPSGESAVKQTVSSGNQVIEEVVESQVYDTKDEVQIQAPAAETEVATTPAVEDEKTGPNLKKNDNVENSNGQPEVPSPKENVITGLDPIFNPCGCRSSLRKGIS